MDDDGLLRVRALDSTDLFARVRLADNFVQRRHGRLFKTLCRERQRLRNGSSSSSSSREEGMDYYYNMDGEEGIEEEEEEDDDDDDDDVGDIFFR